jgi:hypothetical protein
MVRDDCCRPYGRQTLSIGIFTSLHPGVAENPQFALNLTKPKRRERDAAAHEAAWRRGRHGRDHHVKRSQV